MMRLDDAEQDRVNPWEIFNTSVFVSCPIGAATVLGAVNREWGAAIAGIFVGLAGAVVICLVAMPFFLFRHLLPIEANQRVSESRTSLR